MEKNTPQERKESEKQNEPQERKEQAQRATENMLQSFTRHIYNNDLTAFVDNFYKFFEEESKENPEALQQLQDFKKLLEPFRTATQRNSLNEALKQIDCATAEAMTKEPEFNLISDFTIALIGIEKQAALFKIKGELLQYIPREEAEAENKSPVRFLSDYESDIIDEIIDSKGRAAKDSPNYEIIKKVIDDYNAVKTGNSTITQKKITVLLSRYFYYPIDKINQNAFANRQLEELKDNKMGFSVDFITSKEGAKKAAKVKFDYIIDQEQLEKLYPEMRITATLTHYDMFVYCAAASLYNNGNNIFSVTQIHKQMGGRGKPSEKQVKKINASLTKMGMARIIVNNEEETKVHKNTKKFIYDSSMLPFQRGTAVINGKVTDSAIQPDREPPLIEFARKRNQIVTIDRALLEAPINKNENNIAIFSYLLARISRMKNAKSKSNKKILYATLYDNCNVVDKMQKVRAKKTINAILEHFKNKAFIKDYQEAKEGITILL